MEGTLIARWAAGGGKRYIELSRHSSGGYSYRGAHSGGCLPAMPDDAAAVAYMERPWGSGGAGPVTVLKADFKSVRRVEVPNGVLLHA